VNRWAGIDEDTQFDLLQESLNTLCEHLIESGADPELLSAAVFGVFIERMCDSGDRDEYEAILEEALDTPWEEHTLH
jgi:hypothetical protein